MSHRFVFDEFLRANPSGVSRPETPADLQSFRADTRRRFAGFVRDVVGAGRIPKDEMADVEPAIEVTVHDVRTGRSTALATTVMP